MCGCRPSFAWWPLLLHLNLCTVIEQFFSKNSKSKFRSTQPAEILTRRSPHSDPTGTHFIDMSMRIH
jgi:hypothetical protein